MKSAAPSLEFKSLVEAVRFRAVDTPDATALVFLDHGEQESLRLTFRQVDAKARGIAARLATMTEPGARALMLYPSSVDFPCAFLGCLYAGVVAVPAYPPRRNRAVDRLQSIITDAGARVALTTGSTLDALEGRGLLSDESLRFIATDELNEPDADSWRPPSIEPDTLAFLQYTSGSTGLPKGVMVSHRNINANIDVIRAATTGARVRDGLILASWLPLFHDMGLIGSLIWPLIEGGMLVSMEPAAFIQKPVRWLRAISKYRANLSPAPNSGYDLCLSKVTAQQKEGLDLDCWQVAFNGSEPLRRETLDGFAKAFQTCGFRPETMYPCYGLAEATLFVTGGIVGHQPVAESFDTLALERREARAATSDEAAAVVKVGCGRAWSGHTVRIVNPETREACRDNEVGEIWVEGASVAQGYWNRPELSEATFRARIEGEEREGAFLRTGDLGFLKDGVLFVAGRIKDLIIINGLNHYPQDIEHTIEHCHAALAPNACAAFSVEVNGAERLVAVCEIRREHLRRLDAEQAAASIRQAVAEAHELDVHALLFIKPFGMPRTSSGKIQRHVCRAAYLKGDGLEVVAHWRTPAPAAKVRASVASDESADEASIRRWLRARVAAKLGIAPAAVDAREPFTRYGLESRDAIAMTGELQEWLGRALPPTLVYDYPNIEALAAHLVCENETARLSVNDASARSGQVAIIGLGCRFPGADSPENYWRLLVEGREAISHAPNRNDLSPIDSGSAAVAVNRGGYLDGVDLFEPEFFGISGREAELMDPQQRLLVEVAWEALEYAGIAPHDLAGSDTAVAVGISNLDYSRRHPHGASATDAYIATGNALSIAANRISYMLDLRGPSWAVDTACSSSLVAVHQACRSLLAGDCNLALAGGANLILAPQLSVAFSRAGMLSPDGRCKTFDADANGYGRGEGVGLVVLKRLEDAARDGDNILAVIRGSAVTQDGRSNGLTAPNGPAQQATIRRALQAAAVDAHEIGYVEAHGTGTPLGDPIEMNSLVAVFDKGRSEDETCWVGSVKTNIGHLESAAGIAGLIKVVLALMHEAIPPHLQLRRLNPHIALDGTAVRIPTTLQPWRRGNRRLAGVSSFGFGGTNAHVIVEEGPAAAFAREEDAQHAWPVEALALSARTPSALQTLAGAYADFLRAHPEVPLADFARTANTGRAHFQFRRAVVAATAGEAAAQLENGHGNTAPAGAPRIAFLFTGQGSQYRGMGRELFELHSGFRQTLEQCDEFLRGDLPKPLLEVLFGSETEIDETAYAQPALFALEYALAGVWRQWGVVPCAVLGHSVGEYAAACFAGVFSLEDGLRMIAERGRLMQELPRNGAMLSVFAAPETCAEMVRREPELVNIAAVNGTAHVVLSGDAKAIERIESTLAGRGIGVKRLNVSHAFHSPLMKPMVERFGRVAAGVEYRQATTDVISCVSGLKAGAEISTPDYWRDQVLAGVQFSSAVESLAAPGIDALVEIGPKPSLVTMAEECLANPPRVLLSSLEPGGQNWRSMCEALGKLYELGTSVNWRAVDDRRGRRRVALPTYPFERQRYWLEDDAPPPPVATPAPRVNGHPLLGRRMDAMAHLPGTHVWESLLDQSTANWLHGHRLLGSTVAPYSAFVEMALAAAPQICERQFYRIDDLTLHHPLFVSKDKQRVIQVVLGELDDGNLSFRVFSRGAQSDPANHAWTLCASALIRAAVGNEDYEFRTDVFCQQ